MVRDGMDRETNPAPPLQRHDPSMLFPKQESPAKSTVPTAAGGGGDRLKRDEWSEGAVSTLLEAYESKWVLRNRAKLKGHDWEDVAHIVSSRANSTKSPKTQTQCKNKIESMKKRYRIESAADASSWPLYPRLDMLLRGTAVTPVATTLTPPQQPPRPWSQPFFTGPPSVEMMEPLRPPLPLQLPPVRHPPPPPPPPPRTVHNSLGSNGVDSVPAKEDGVGTKASDQESDKSPTESDSSTPAIYSHNNQDHGVKNKLKKATMKMKKKKRKKKKKKETTAVGGTLKMAQSMRWLAEAIVRTEQARMETMKEVERMRMEAEAKRGEMDLKRTEIIASTQLEIARLLAGVTGAEKGIDSSLRIGRN
ncbi:hypothetical protein SAY87_031121 [Trapa incisa]|uniref:Myb/SANT-like DNA-binding domain-containing protein n=1 Tax=Trapa incisa TaxID=236973 RepID=A0AAN7KQK3_9MYRT|nr:hypothetical protein SAY87_031121 [Trapa incisa]